MEDLPKHENERVTIDPEPFMRKPNRIVPCERTQRIGQFVGARHFGVIHKNGDDLFALPHGLFDLEPNDIVGFVQSPPAVVVDCSEPAPTDDSQKYIALGYFGFDDTEDVGAGRHVVDIHEQLLARKGLFQACK